MNTCESASGGVESIFGTPVHAGWKTAASVMVKMVELPMFKKPPDGNLNGVHVFGREVVVPVGVAQIWRRRGFRSGGMLYRGGEERKCLLYCGSSIFLGDF